MFGNRRNADSSTCDVTVVILREYLYVDVDKVRSFVAQLEGGVAEELRSTERDGKANVGGFKGFATHEHSWSNEEYVHKSLADAIFSDLEERLDSLNLLVDLSSDLQNDAYWESQRLRTDAPAGTLVRITSPGAIFDARYVAKIFSSFGAAVSGWGQFAPELRAPAAPPQKGRSQGQGRQRDNPRVSTESLPELEDMVKDFPPMPGEGPGVTVGPDVFRSIIKIARGVFQPGVHLTLTPSVNLNYSVHARLQEGRRYLESDSDILFSRYGFEAQEWTVVGTVGCHAPIDEMEAPDGSAIAGTISNSTTIGRTAFARFINTFMEYLARVGFADLPQWPGLSLVPLAVYRTVPNSVTLQPAVVEN